MVVDYTVVPVAPDSNDYDMSTEEGRTAYQQAYNDMQSSRNTTIHM